MVGKEITKGLIFESDNEPRIVVKVDILLFPKAPAPGKTQVKKVLIHHAAHPYTEGDLVTVSEEQLFIRRYMEG